MRKMWPGYVCRRFVLHFLRVDYQDSKKRQQRRRRRRRRRYMTLEEAGEEEEEKALDTGAFNVTDLQRM